MQNINNAYIAENALFEVNLPSAIRSTLLRDLEAIRLSSLVFLVKFESAIFTLKTQEESDVSIASLRVLFDAAQVNIYSLMAYDSFRRYLASNEYLLLRASLLEETLLP